MKEKRLSRRGKSGHDLDVSGGRIWDARFQSDGADGGAPCKTTECYSMN
jgi:hypothetical protein